TAVEFTYFSAIFHPSTHYKWGRRFRLPTRYVLPQKASPLASRHNRGNLSLGDWPVPSRRRDCRGSPLARLYPAAGPSSPGTAKWTKLLSDRFGHRFGAHVSTRTTFAASAAFRKSPSRVARGRPVRSASSR